jgi:murein L,D-transpeptidase YafK
MKNNKTRLIIYSFISILFLIYFKGRSIWHPVYIKFSGKTTAGEVYQKVGSQVEKTFQTIFKTKGMSYPPKNISLICLKSEQVLELWADGKLIKNYQFTAYSGVLGPKLKEGDGQIPEGLYNVDYLNPNSSYHLSIKINYPNKFDRDMAKKDNRSNIGSNIFIHGKAVTIGCIPIGDKSIEELFVLVHKIGKENVNVIISPIDFRSKKNIQSPTEIPWQNEKYKRIQSALGKYKS